MAAREFDEKRAFMRMQIETPVEFSVNGNTDTLHRGVSHDLSASGLLMSSGFAPTKGDEIEVIMNTGDDRLPPFVASGKVVRVEADPVEADRYQISVKLVRSE